MKALRNIAAALVLACLAAPVSQAGSFAISLTSPGSQTGTAVPTATAFCQEGVGATQPGTATSSGPLGLIDVSPQGWHQFQQNGVSGNVSAGSYPCAITVFSSGFAYVTMSW